MITTLKITKTFTVQKDKMINLLNYSKDLPKSTEDSKDVMISTERQQIPSFFTTEDSKGVMIGLFTEDNKMMLSILKPTITY